MSTIVLTFIDIACYSEHNDKQRLVTDTMT